MNIICCKKWNADDTDASNEDKNGLKIRGNPRLEISGISVQKKEMQIKMEHDKMERGHLVKLIGVFFCLICQFDVVP